jgi:hypothetical protein
MDVDEGDTSEEETVDPSYGGVDDKPRPLSL